MSSKATPVSEKAMLIARATSRLHPKNRKSFVNEKRVSRGMDIVGRERGHCRDVILARERAGKDLVHPVRRRQMVEKKCGGRRGEDADKAAEKADF